MGLSYQNNHRSSAPPSVHLSTALAQAVSDVNHPVNQPAFMAMLVNKAKKLPAGTKAP